jgi:hypothetical protein
VVLLLLLWKTVLECVLKITIFMCSHKKKSFTSQQQQGLDLDLLTQKMQVLPRFMIYRDHTTNSIRRQENPFRFVSDLSRSHRAHGKENTQIEMSNNSKIK